MKRSKPLRRGKPLERTRRLRSVSPGRRRSQAVRRAAEAVLFEQRPYCWFDGETGVPVHGHELLSRSQGGSPERPDALLCNRHNAWCEDNPAQAAWLGWKVSRKHPAMPCIESGECRPWDHTKSDTCVLLSESQRAWRRITDEMSASLREAQADAALSREAAIQAWADYAGVTYPEAAS